MEHLIQHMNYWYLYPNAASNLIGEGLSSFGYKAFINFSFKKHSRLKMNLFAQIDFD